MWVRQFPSEPPPATSPSGRPPTAWWLESRWEQAPGTGGASSLPSDFSLQGHPCPRGTGETRAEALGIPGRACSCGSTAVTGLGNRAHTYLLVVP